MPAEQRGSVYPTSRGFGIQWRDEHGARQRQSGFKSRSEARTWFADVERKRMRGERRLPPAHAHCARRRVPRAARRRGEHDPGARRSAEARDRGHPGQPRATERAHGLGEIRLDRLDVRTVAAWRQSAPRGFSVARAQGAAAGARLRGPGEARLGERRQARPEPGAETPGGPDVRLVGADLEPRRRASCRAAVSPHPRGRDGTSPRGMARARTARRRHQGRRPARPPRLHRRPGEGVREAVAVDPTRPATCPCRRRARSPPVADRHPARVPRRPRRPSEPARLAPGRMAPRARGRGRGASSTPYAMRHTFASFAIAAGVSLFYLARIMGTSRRADRHAPTGTCSPTREDYLRGLLDSFDSASLGAVTTEESHGTG